LVTQTPRTFTLRVTFTGTVVRYRTFTVRVVVTVRDAWHFVGLDEAFAKRQRSSHGVGESCAWVELSVQACGPGYQRGGRTYPQADGALPAAHSA
jgi:hypothetical protein